MSDSPEFHEDRIEETRARIDAHLEQLSRQLTPGGVLTSLLGDSGGSATDIGEAAIRNAREKPLAAALMGAGIVGMMLAGRPARQGQPQATAKRNEPSGASGDPAESMSRHTTEIKQRVNDMTSDIRENIDEFSAAARRGVEKTRKQAEEIGETVADYAGRTAKAAADAPHYAREQGEAVADSLHSGFRSASHAVESGARRSQDGIARLADWARENPVPTGLLALAAGAVAASVLTAKRVPPRKAAAVESSRKLHRAARRQEADPDTKGADRFQEFQRAAEVDRPASNANNPEGLDPSDTSTLPTPDARRKAGLSTKNTNG